MAYYLNSVCDHLAKRCKGKAGRYFDPTSQDTARTLKIYDTLMWILYRYEQMLIATNLEAFEVEIVIERFKVLQEPIFTKVFDCLKAIAYKNPKIQKVLWKHREFLVVEKRALAKQLGELDLINYVINNQQLLYQCNDLDSLTVKVLKRMSKENY